MNQTNSIIGFYIKLSQLCLFDEIQYYYIYGSILYIIDFNINWLIKSSFTDYRETHWYFTSI